jgi:hypothetical protein
MKLRHRLVAPFALFLTVSVLPATTSCAAGWWQSITSNPAGAIQTFLTYVIGFLQSVSTIWGMIFPLIPASAQQAAQTAWNNAIVTVQQSVAILEDAVRAAAAAQQSTPDFSKLIANIQAAVASLMAIITQWQTNGATPSGDAGAAGATGAVATSPGYAEVVRQAGVIKSWK